MSAERYYHICNKNIGEPVEITCHDGSVHRGYIDRVNETHLYLRPFDEGRGFDSPWTFLWGSYGWGLGAGIALGTIATLAFLPFFGW